MASYTLRGDIISGQNISRKKTDFPEILRGFHGPFPLLNHHHHHLEAQGPVFSEPASCNDGTLE